MNISIGSDTVFRIPSSLENVSLGMLLNDVNLSELINMSVDSMVDNITSQLDNADHISTNRRDPMAIVVPVTVCYAIIFIAGVLGNVITCTVISRNKSMHTATNYYLFNLAVSDLLLLISGMPPETYNIWFPASYPLNQSFCILQGLLSETSTNATVLTITSFTVERYIAICHPFRQHTMSKLSRAIKFIMAVWIVAFCLAIPQAIQFGIVTKYGGERSCTVKNVLVDHAFEVSSFLFFVGPMTLICVLYVLIGIKLRKSKLLQGVKRRGCEFGRGITGQTRVIRMLIAVAVAFFLCWAPFHAQRIMAFYGNATKTNNVLFNDIYMVLTYVSGVLYFMSTCINPLLYSIMSHKFRDAFKSTLARHFRLRSEYHQNHTYSALSKCHGNASIRLTAATVNRQCDGPHIQKQESDLSILDREQYVKCKCPNQTCQTRCISICSQSTVLTTVSKNEIIGTAAANNCRPDGIRTIQLRDGSNQNGGKNGQTNGQHKNGNQPVIKMLDEKSPPHHKALSTIAEKFRRGTKKVFLFNNIPVAQHPLPPPLKEEKLKKLNSVDSAHTNTISNSSLQEMDDEEFDSAELAKFMGEINKEIRA